ncbi:hypothetical protein D9758_008961 [Tetrapyrgos nigripes]|uniref:Uncharacterized protein n=1 Tax=Tetrapyrgos nigripes TaxID=182062 RepID=A0A8H5GKD9_9AGAR|nr:hypothetical protein D9758_008961 [Tetrapyrgos nigripes]
MSNGSERINLPPDQSFRLYRVNGEWTIQLSVAEKGIRLGENSDLGTKTAINRKAFHVFAEFIQLSKSFAVDLNADAACTISTHDFTLVDPPSTKDDPSLSIVAAPGVDNHSGGTPTESMDGRDAGVLSIYIESCSTQTTSDLRVAARGGDGGDTREKGATAGNGGHGGHVQLVAYHAMMDVSSLCDAFARSKYEITSILTDQHPAYLDLVAILKTTKPDSRSSYSTSTTTGDLSTKDLVVLVAPIQKLSDRVVDSLDSPPTVNEAKNVVSEVRQNLQAQFVKDSSQLHGNIHVEGGEAGSYLGISDGSRGSAGKPGSVGSDEPYIFLRDLDAKRLRKQTLVSVHPEQCEMLYERAMTYWYFATDTCRQKAMQLLQRLLYRLRFLPLQESDPLYKASRSFDPTSTIYSFLSLSREDLKTKAMGQLCVLQAGNVDFYGYTRYWVPRLSWDIYNAVLGNAIVVYTRLETSYIQYHAALDQQKEVNHEALQASSTIDSTLQKMKGEKSELVDQLNTLDKKVLSAGAALDLDHEALITAYEKVVDKIKESHGLTFKSVINALMKIAEKPKDPLEYGKQIFALENDWNNKVLNDSGVAVDKKLLLSKVNHSSITGLDDFTGDLSPEEKNGEFKVDGNLPGFLIEEAKLKEVLADYTQGALGEAGDELKKKFKEFTDAIVARNNDIVTYNALLTVVKNNLDEASKLQEAKLTAQKIIIIGPDLQAMTDYMRMIYENARARVMRYLNIGQRALTFKILRSENLLKMYDGSGFNGDIDQNDIPLSLTSDVLASIKSNLDDLLLRGEEEAGISPALFPGNWETGIGKRRYLSAEELQTFLQNKQVKLSILPVYPGQDTDPLSTDFRSSANVRVYRVAFYLQGLKSKIDIPQSEDRQPVFMSTITHSGSEVIVSMRGVGNYFEHDRLDVKHSSRIAADGSKQVLENGEFVRLSPDGKDSMFGAPGPFTVWEVDSRDTEWDKLDLSGVYSGYLQFCGTNYAFKSS